jgi:uncharacterized protein (TIGR02996 family)
VAALVDAISARVPPRPVVVGQSMSARAKNWEKVVSQKDPADVPRLVAAIASRNWIEGAQRMANMVDWPADPRIATGVVASLDQLKKPTKPALNAAVAVLEKMADPRSLDAATNLSGADKKPFLAMMSALKAVKITFSDEDRALVTEVDKLLANERRGSDEDKLAEAELLAAIFAAESDDGPRLVLADWLSGRGDPRGDLISAQIAGDEKHAAALIKKHYDAWLGPIGQLVVKNTVRFERGLFHAGRVDPRVNDRETQARVERTVGDSRWATVRELEFGTTPALQPAAVALLAHPVMARLQRLLGMFWHVLGAVCEKTPMPAVEHLGVSFNKLQKPDLDKIHTSFPSLHCLRVSAFDLDVGKIFDHPLAERLTGLELNNSRGIQLDRAPPTLRRFTLGSWWQRHWTLTYSRTDAGPFTRLQGEGDVPSEMAARLLEGVPSGALREIVLPPTVAAELADEIRRATR